MGTITLKGMEFFAYHGCMPEEQVVGTRFIIDLKMDIDATLAEETDDLSKTIDYQEVYTILKQQMQTPSKLIEHVARRCADTVLKHFPQIKGITIHLSKLNPPLGGNVKSVGYRIKINK